MNFNDLYAGKIDGNISQVKQRFGAITGVLSDFLLPKLMES